jgi:Family of unknown function (DUF5372)
VFFLDADGTQYSLPPGWTDAAGPDASVAVAAGRSPFRVLALALALPLEGRPSSGRT